MAQQVPRHLGKVPFSRAERLGCSGQRGTQGWGMWLAAAMRSAWGAACPITLGMAIKGPIPAGPARLSSSLEPLQ